MPARVLLPAGKRGQAAPFAETLDDVIQVRFDEEPGKQNDHSAVTN